MERNNAFVMEGKILALICDMELESGLMIPDAYLRITSFSGSENHVNFNLSVFINENSFDDEKPAVTQIAYSMDFDKDRNLFRQMYEYLKTLPEYEDAVEA